MEYIVMPADTFLVVNKTIMHDDDRLILTMLYEPIIGSMAISLYFTLWNYLDRKEVISSSLKSFTPIKIFSHNFSSILSISIFIPP